ncbi:MAG: alpha/beta hydrolase [Campylobacterales bacterium]|nr:alpha/beta hydrolase [Campylobacterales bacterium]
MIKVLMGVVVLYVGAMGYLYFTQEKQIFAAHLIEEKPAPQGENLEPLALHVNENVVLEGILRKDEQSNAGLLLYFGGNADDATRFVLHVKALQGYDVIAFNYRGYGKSGGKPSEEAFFSDALKIYDTYARGRKVVIMGRSLGSGVASFLASKRVNDGLVLLTPYDSIVSVAQKKYPMFPIRFLLKHTFESVRYVAFVSAPIAIMEVQNDATIPRYHLEKLIEAIPQTPLHVSFSNTTHGDVLTHPSFCEELQKILGNFNE